MRSAGELSWFRWVWSFGVVVVLLVPRAQAQTDSLDVRGVEICPQSVCEDGAVFTYSLFHNGRRVGGGLVQVDHNAVLPGLETPCVPVFGGAFAFRVGLQFVRGAVIEGEICATDDPDLFAVTLFLLTDDGLPLSFLGELDHSPLRRRFPRPPVIRGELFLGVQ